MRIRVTTVAAVMALAAPAAAHAADDDARYALVHGCYALQSQASGKFIAQTATGYRATASGAGEAEPFRMQATQLGQYLLYGKDRDFLAGDGTAVEPAAQPSPAADWRVDADGERYTLTLPATGRRLRATADGAVSLAGGGVDDAARFSFVEADGCPEYPEIDAGIEGVPPKGRTPYDRVVGTFDGHLHMMAYEFLGGRVHCGAPWHRYGAPYALPDCMGGDPVNGAVSQGVDAVYTGEVGTVQEGWPTFEGWPNYHSVTYEQTYWKWMERAWKGGLRLVVNLFVDNEVLCNVYPLKKNPCNDMHSVRLQHQRITQLQDYVDAQYGGPGKGFFRIVTSPSEARRVINDGKLAVVLGIEVSRLFECGVQLDKPQCTKEQVDRRLDEVHRLGVRGMEVVNKFDNAFSGVAGDRGTTGVIVNAGNFLQTGAFWKMQTCPGDGHDHDREQTTLAGTDRDSIFNGLAAFLPLSVPPLYPAGPHCNARGLTPLGEHLVRKMVEKGMMVDPDHMSVVARAKLLDILEQERYAGTISSHSWADDSSIKRILALGGVVSPMGNSSSNFLPQWRQTRQSASGKFPFGIGFGADMNGFASQGAPRASAKEKPLQYPFKTVDGLTAHRQRSGTRTFDFNEDGVAHYGLWADWIEDLRVLEGDAVVRDLKNGAEAYLSTWERAEGIKGPECLAGSGRFGRTGLGSVRLDLEPDMLLRAAGQPGARDGQAWRWCTTGGKGRVSAVFTNAARVGLVLSTARGHAVGGVRVGSRASRLPRAAKRVGSAFRVRAVRGTRYVYGVKAGRVRFVAVARPSVAGKARALRRAVRLAGLR
ncbi:Coagulation factor 5/8 type domain-containing protein [Conexibacter sp. SYSU D00693]|uniref:Coagulation factor 5/8 type domain-containing protein n=1 Tax=Conexibacter sp. SYSU D00693 TaxID=2812560 RepID=UPI00196A88AE|nr:Coagulation factor 5/8 type domain-containing protein [Conexibacter sp. SYSU D00693]